MGRRSLRVSTGCEAHADKMQFSISPGNLCVLDHGKGRVFQIATAQVEAGLAVARLRAEELGLLVSPSADRQFLEGWHHGGSSRFPTLSLTCVALCLEPDLGEHISGTKIVVGKGVEEPSLTHAPGSAGVSLLPSALATASEFRVDCRKHRRLQLPANEQRLCAALWGLPYPSQGQPAGSAQVVLGGRGCSLP